jgi:hypothetical protein
MLVFLRLGGSWRLCAELTLHIGFAQRRKGPQRRKEFLR